MIGMVRRMSESRWKGGEGVRGAIVGLLQGFRLGTS